MLAVSSSYSLEKLFRLYRERFDKEGRLSALAPETTADGWSGRKNPNRLRAVCPLRASRSLQTAVAVSDSNFD